MKRTKEEAEETKQSIIASALDIFDKKGYDKTSLNEIAENAGVTRGAIYWHFKDKFDILTEIVYNYIDYMIKSAMVIKTDTNENALDELRYRLDDYFNRLLTDEKFSKYIRILEYELLGKYHDVKKEINLEKLKIDSFQVIESFVKKGQKQGVIRDDLGSEFLTFILFGAMLEKEKVLVGNYEKFNVVRDTKKLVDDLIVLIKK